MSLISIISTGKFWKHLLLASVAGFALLYGGFLLIDMYTQHGEEVEVPDFKGIYIQDLNTFVDGHSINYEIVDSVYSSKVAKGTVVDQNPVPGAKVKNGRVVYLTVNAMLSRKVKMPNLIDLSLKQATSLLETYGLQVGMLRYVEGLPPVMEMHYKGKPVKEGQMIDEGSKIDLVLGKGSDGGLIPIPSLLGMSLTDARRTITENRLNLGNVNMDVEGLDTLKAKVWKQNPGTGSGEGLYEGAVMSIWLTESETLLQDANSTSGNDDEDF
ncbi:MAG: PASTA domain-containing protein [Bacteroidia bacterium]